MNDKINNPNILFLATITMFIMVVLSSCNPLSGTDVLQGSDTIAPVINITSPADGQPYSPTVTVTGSITDAADAEGTEGRVDSLTWEVTGTALGGAADIESDGSFSFEFNTLGLTGTITLKITAVDWNSNDAELTLELAAPKEITYFAFLAEDNAAAGLSEDAVGVIDGTEIRVDLPENTDWSILVPRFESTGLRVKVGTEEQDSGSSEQDFTEPVTYTVEANDGTTKDYIVRIRNLYQLSFHKNDPAATGAMDSILLIEGESITLPANNFSKADYSFIGWALSEDGSVEYLDAMEFVIGGEDITLYAQWECDLKVISTFDFTSPAYTVTIEENTITLLVPCDMDITSLVAEFTTNGVLVTVDGVEQTSGITLNDFSDNLVYTVEAVDGSTRDYTVVTIIGPPPSEFSVQLGTQVLIPDDLIHTLYEDYWIEVIVDGYSLLPRIPLNIFGASAEGNGTRITGVFLAAPFSGYEGSPVTNTLGYITGEVTDNDAPLSGTYDVTVQLHENPGSAAFYSYTHTDISISNGELVIPEPLGPAPPATLYEDLETPYFSLRFDSNQLDPPVLMNRLNRTAGQGSMLIENLAYFVNHTNIEGEYRLSFGGMLADGQPLTGEHMLETCLYDTPGGVMLVQDSDDLVFDDGWFLNINDNLRYWFSSEAAIDDLWMDFRINGGSSSDQFRINFADPMYEDDEVEVLATGYLYQSNDYMTETEIDTHKIFISGELTDSSGIPFTEAEVEFRIYEGAAGGIHLWGETWNFIWE